MSPRIVSEAAVWFPEPGADCHYFDCLEMAVAKAVSTPRDERHPGAKIVTKSGATYGWDAISDGLNFYQSVPLENF